MLWKEHSAVAVRHNHFRTAVYLFSLPRESFQSNKSQSEDFISESQVFLFFVATIEL